jgi:hypothetical protein
MTHLELHKKTGFRNNDTSTPILIIEKVTNKPFYDTSWLENPVKYFNLPEGEYYTTSDIEMLKSPVPKKIKKLPKKERRRPNPNNFKIMFGDNPNICSIDWDRGEIIFDSSLRELPLPHLIFLLYHELGHEHFGTEEYADAFARNMMLLNGYNESQIGLAVLEIGEGRLHQRKALMIDSLIN